MKPIQATIYFITCLAAAASSATAGLCTAFPSAEGFGALATGGRGGEIYHVTNLEDSGPGSFRDAVAKGKRIVVFDVAGYVDLKSMVSVASDITIAGQTAPGEGIATRNYEISFSKSHNVIVRYIRFRQGLTPKQEKKYVIGLTEGSNMIFDHVSVEWGRWDCIGMTKSKDITFQNCIIGPGIAPQRFGSLCESENVTFSHNLWISNQSRNPKSKGVVQYVNNVVYNWGVCGYVGGHSAGNHAADVIGNYFIKGPNSSEHFAGEFKPTDHIFEKGNVIDMDLDGTLNGKPAKPQDFGSGENAPTLVHNSSIKPPVEVKLDTAEAAYQKIVASAGCSLRRDSVDTILIADLTSLGKKGKTIKDPAEMGGFGEIHGGPAKITAGGDGIPEAWKKAHHINLLDAHAANSVSNQEGISGYTHIERFINELADIRAAQ